MISELFNVFLSFFDTKKGKFLAILVLFLSTSSLMMFADKHVKELADEHSEGLKEFILSEHKQLNRELCKIENNIIFLKQDRSEEILQRGVAAYSKILTISDLQRNPGNRVNIIRALSDKKARKVLYILDNERTEIFMKYLNIQE